jgi:opacity protein-like surface antigen
MLAMPVYFSPKGGSGITLDGDYGRVSSAKFGTISQVNHPTALGGRIYLGLPIITLGLGASVFDSKVATQVNATQYQGTAAFKLLGGALMPVAISLQAGAGYLKFGSGTGATKTVSIPVGIGVGLNIPTPGASVEPWVAARVHLTSTSAGSGSTSVSQTQTGVGISGGLSVGLMMGLGLHVGFDWSSFGAKVGSPIVSAQQKLNQFVVGAGVHYMIKLPGLPGVPII